MRDRPHEPRSATRFPSLKRKSRPWQRAIVYFLPSGETAGSRAATSGTSRYPRGGLPVRVPRRAERTSREEAEHHRWMERGSIVPVRPTRVTRKMPPFRIAAARRPASVREGSGGEKPATSRGIAIERNSRFFTGRVSYTVPTEIGRHGWVRRLLKADRGQVEASVAGRDTVGPRASTRTWPRSRSRSRPAAFHHALAGRRACRKCVTARALLDGRHAPTGGCISVSRNAPRLLPNSIARRSRSPLRY